MNTKIITYGILCIAIALAAVFVRQSGDTFKPNDMPAAAIGQVADQSPTVSASQAHMSVSATPSGMLTGLVTPMVTQVTRLVSPTVSVSPSLTPSVTPRASPSPSLTQSGQMTVSPSQSHSSQASPTLSASVTPVQASQTPEVSVTLSVSPTVMSPSPVTDSVVINEIAWMGTEAQASDEWIELYNSSSRTISVGGWKLLIAGDNSINLSGSIPSYGYYLLERTSGNTVSNIVEDYTGSFGRYGLNNAGEMLSLINETGILVDEIDCKNGWFSGIGVKGGASMERKSPNKSSNDDPTNWATFSGPAGDARDAAGNPISGTPRGRNSAANY